MILEGVDLSRVPTPCLEALRMAIDAEVQSRDIEGWQKLDDYFAGYDVQGME